MSCDVSPVAMFFIQSDKCQRKEVLDTFAMCGRAVRWVLVAVICAPGGVDLVKGTLQEKGVLRLEVKTF